MVGPLRRTDRAPLLPLKLRRALFTKRRYPLDEIAAAAGLALKVAFARKLGWQVVERARPRRLLDQAEHRGRTCSQPFGERHGVGHEGCIVEHLIDEADALGLLGAHL